MMEVVHRVAAGKSRPETLSSFFLTGPTGACPVERRCSQTSELLIQAGSNPTRA